MHADILHSYRILQPYVQIKLHNRSRKFNTSSVHKTKIGKLFVSILKNIRPSDAPVPVAYSAFPSMNIYSTNLQPDTLQSSVNLASITSALDPVVHHELVPAKKKESCNWTLQQILIPRPHLVYPSHPFPYFHPLVGISIFPRPSRHFHISMYTPFHTPASVHLFRGNSIRSRTCHTPYSRGISSTRHLPVHLYATVHHSIPMHTTLLSTCTLSLVPVRIIFVGPINRHVNVVGLFLR